MNVYGYCGGNQYSVNSNTNLRKFKENPNKSSSSTGRILALPSGESNTVLLIAKRGCVKC
jgi:hypothetical protein